MQNSKCKIAVASGKGGVGKSMLASALSMLFSQDKKIVAVDCDVDAPNLHLWLGLPSEALAKEGERELKFANTGWTVEKISTNEKPEIDQKKCNLCGKCVDICAFGALEKKRGLKSAITLNSFFCEGCGACEVVCPQKAIKMQKVLNAEIRVKQVGFQSSGLNHWTGVRFPLVSAQLYPGETGSGKIVEKIKARAEQLEYGVMLLDSPAGTGCPVIATLKDVDFAVLVTEPTPSALSDLKRALMIVDYFKIPFGVVINKWDIYPELSLRIKTEFKNKILGKMSYDKRIFQAIANLTPIMETELFITREIKDIFKRFKNVF